MGKAGGPEIGHFIEEVTVGSDTAPRVRNFISVSLSKLSYFFLLTF